MGNIRPIARRIVALIGRARLHDINARVPVGAGGEYLHYSFALLTLRRVEEDCYLIHDLSFFKRMSPGWFPVVEDGSWRPS